MPEYWFYVILGIVQGSAEWLPVSSEGMLTLIGLVFGLNFDEALRIAIWLHLGTVGAVLVKYRQEWLDILFNFDKPVPERKFVIWTTVGTAITGIPVKVLLLDVLDPQILTVAGYMIIGSALLLTSLLLYFSSKMENYELTNLESLSTRQQLLIGMTQGFTIIPGISRSGTTVSALLLFKTKNEDSFKGSFLMSVPAVLGATVLDTADIVFAGQSLPFNLVGVTIGITLAFLMGLLTIELLIRLAKKINFATFTFGLGILLLSIGVVILI